MSKQKKNNDDAFTELAKLAMDDAFAAMSAEMRGEPYISKIVWPKIKYYIVEALRDHTRYIDAGIGGAEQEVKKGQILKVQDISIHSLNMKNFKLLKVVEE